MGERAFHEANGASMSTEMAVYVASAGSWRPAGAERVGRFWVSYDD